MDAIRLNLRLILLVVAVFILNKLVLRPYVLEHDFSEFARIFVLSFPNFCEAVVGTLMLTNFALIANARYLSSSLRVKENYLYLIVVLLAAIYVILQELKIHNLGGRNVYDPNDLIFSVIGLIAVYVFLLIRQPIYQFNPDS